MKAVASFRKKKDATEFSREIGGVVVRKEETKEIDLGDGDYMWGGTFRWWEVCSVQEDIQIYSPC